MCVCVFGGGGGGGGQLHEEIRFLVQNLMVKPCSLSPHQITLKPERRLK